MEIYWQVDPSDVERAELDEWLLANEYDDIAAVSIDRTLVIAFGSETSLEGRGTSEIRALYPDLTSALNAVLARLRS